MLESRRPMSSLLGKCTDEVKTKVSEETKIAFERVAREAGMLPAELLREMVIVRAHGKNALQSMYEHRIAVVSGEGPEKAP